MANVILVAAAEIQRMDRVLRAIADPTRRSILELVRAGDSTVKDLTASTAITQSAVSQHLAVLKAAGLVSGRRVGRWVYYRADPHGLDQLARWATEGDRHAQTGSATVHRRPPDLDELRHLRRARDLIDREYANPLDVPAMAEAAFMSPAHFSRRFRAAYGETPYGYLMTRRIERAQELLRGGTSVTDACLAVGCTSVGSFSARFREITGSTPSRYRSMDHADLEVVPPCVAKVQLRPRRHRVEQDPRSIPE